MQHKLYKNKQVIIRYGGLGPQRLHELVDQHPADQQLVPVAAEHSGTNDAQLRYHRQFQHEVLYSVAYDLRYRFQDALWMERGVILRVQVVYRSLKFILIQLLRINRAYSQMPCRACLQREWETKLYGIDVHFGTLNLSFQYITNFDIC